MPVDPYSWSTTPASNTSVDGVNIGENCNPGNLNNADRAIMAGVKELADDVTALTSTVAGKLSASGAVFTGSQPTYTGEGAMLHNAGSGYTSGKVTFLADGSSDPSGSAGDIAIFYTP